MGDDLTGPLAALVLALIIQRTATLACTRPDPTNAPKTMITFFPGLLSSEFAPHFLAGFAAAFAALLRRFGLRGLFFPSKRLDKNALLLAASAYVATGAGADALRLLSHARGARRARRVFSDALRAQAGVALGDAPSPGWTSRLLAQVAGFAMLPLAPALAFGGFRPGGVSRRVQTLGNVRVALAGEKGRPLVADVYAPRAPPPPAGGPGARPRPLLLYIHGGGWIAGDKRFDQTPMMRRLAADGWVVAALNYRLCAFVPPGSTRRAPRAAAETTASLVVSQSLIHKGDELFDGGGDGANGGGGGGGGGGVDALAGVTAFGRRVSVLDQVVDCKRAVAWLRDPGNALIRGLAGGGGGGIGTGSAASPVAVAGESAGGHLALVMALTNNDRRWQPGFEGLDCSVCACVDVHGVHDFEDSEGYFHFSGSRWAHDKRGDEAADAWAHGGAGEADAPERPAWFASLGAEDEEDEDGGGNDEAEQQPRRRHRKKSSFLRFLEQIVVQKQITTEAGRARFREVSPLWLMERHAERCAGAGGGGGLAGLPPIMGVHGDNDYLVPVEDSRHFYRRLRELRGSGDGNEHVVGDVYVELEGAHHAFGLMASPRSFALSDAACAFLNAAVGRKGELGDDGGDGRLGVHLPSKL